MCTKANILPGENVHKIGLLVAFLKDTGRWCVVQELRMTGWRIDTDTGFLC